MVVWGGGTDQRPICEEHPYLTECLPVVAQNSQPQHFFLKHHRLSSVSFPHSSYRAEADVSEIKDKNEIPVYG